MNKMISLFSDNPGKLFIVDGTGALITSALLFVFLKIPMLNTGLPDVVLVGLLVISLLISCYSFVSSFAVKKKRKNFIILNGILNLFYCLLTFGFLMYYHREVTVLGKIYFTLEILIIGVLIYVELLTAKAIRN
ncbi:hypothetical protein [Flavobacterium cerinum]|uniref:Uncharacterized protein n=1 Tax=Flavobacterium cerinum TaxID=2502784 RepID=A0ABY5IWV3_9FLAO|nr:hypothetical protein [Flavobacterium cerinum]UUC47295.1 hypothetical protein NOX80_08860 [Flavobacterium cerinum]